MEAVTNIIVLAVITGIFALHADAQTAGQVKEIKLKGLTAISAPGYELVIRNDGTVVYNGENEVKQEGRRTSRISKPDFQKLVSKIEQIRFFNLKDRYNDYPLDQPHEATRANPTAAQQGAAATEATAEGTIITDLPSQIVTVVANNRTKSVEDRMGAPKGLFELEQMILDVTHSSQWTGFVNNARDIPYYASFPLNKRVTFRGLVQHYSHSSDRNAPAAGYMLMILNNSGIEFELKAPPQIDPGKFDGYIVDATGRINKTRMVEPVFVLTDIRRVRRYLPARAH